MDRIQAMQIFVQVVTQGSYSRAATLMGVPRAAATQAVQQLEARLGVRLLNRTTRHVSLTLDGDLYFQRCQVILGDLEDTEATFRAGRTLPKGRLRVDMPGALGRLLVIPALPEFTRRYPDITLELGVRDRTVDLIREGVDCVLRAGDISDTSLVCRPVGVLEQITAASPDYLKRHGTPLTPQEIGSGHRMVGYLSSRTGRPYDLDFVEGGILSHASPPVTVTVSDAGAYIASGVAGYGLVQGPRYHLDPLIASGQMTEVLSGFRPPAMPLSVLYPPGRHRLPRLRVFIDWLCAALAPATASPASIAAE
ncbi:LysR family transcriptional regulator [Novispirillum itersonii]|uniref:LysR family transcriptional regulator n=1 Tax=Novispirillum itersonii TaxID=189 RepID=UPI00036C1B00|nr:LysR family transcriptional regulator [Novispirillum itersonii]